MRLPMSLRSWCRRLEKAQAFDSQVHIINGAIGLVRGLEIGGQDGGSEGRKGDADEAGSGQDQGCIAFGSDADQASAAVEAGSEIDVSIFGEGETLWTASVSYTHLTLPTICSV